MTLEVTRCFLAGPDGNAAQDAARAYRDAHYRAIVRGVLEGDGRSFARARELRAAVVRERFSDREGRDQLLTVRAALRDDCARYAPELLTPPSHDWFEHKGARCTSMLRRPGSLHASLGQRASAACLAALSERRADAQAILERSALGQTEDGYETFERDGLPCVRGADGDQLRHLSGLAHELGHCLQEQQTGWGSYYARIISEAAAQVFEQVVVAAWLRAELGSDAAQQWAIYQRRVDVLAYLFCELDCADALGEPPPPSPFDRGFGFLRGSYATDPGMECVFAAASIQRTRVLRDLALDASAEEALAAVTRGTIAGTCSSATRMRLA